VYSRTKKTVLGEKKCTPGRKKLSSIRKSVLPDEKDCPRLEKVYSRTEKTVLAILNEIQLQCPSLQEQVEIVRRVQLLFESAVIVAARLAMAKNVVERLTPATLAKAFRGELVQQDPNDEPASDMLAQIQERTPTATKRPRPGKTRATHPRKELATAMRKLIDVLTDAGDWMTAQEAFRSCGITDGSSTDLIERVYAELRELGHSNRVAVETVRDAHGRKLHDRLKFIATN